MTYHQASWLININSFIIGKHYGENFIEDLIIVPASNKTIPKASFINLDIELKKEDFEVVVVLSHENLSISAARKKGLIINFFDFFHHQFSQTSKH